MSTTKLNGSNAANNNKSQQPSNQQNVGKETIQPLIRRSILYRLDVYPFIISYLLLILCDFYYSSSAIGDGASYSLNYNVGQTTTNNSLSTTILSSVININIVIDILYLLLLIIQLIIFLKCQWDTIFYSKVAYRKYTFQSTNKQKVSMTVGPGVGEVEDDECDNIQQKKIEDMESWTHCLVIPPNPYGSSSTKSSNDGSNKGTAAASTMQTVRPEKPGIVPVKIVTTSTSIHHNNGSKEEEEVTSFVAMIHFRGWTYRCCCNSLLLGSKVGKLKMDEHYDLPMESIWHKEDRKKTDENGDTINTSHHSTPSTTSTWEPQFNRLNFPTSLPISFYTHKWSGQSTSTHLSSTIQIYGSNTTNIPLPPYLSLLTQQLLQPMFLFQLLCVLLWSLDEYWMYAIFTLGTLVMFESLQAMNRWKSVKRLREEVSGGSGGEEGGGNNGRKEIVQCYRMGEWITIATNELVVGDVISLISPSIHNKQQMNRQNAIRSAHDHDRGCAIPADLLLLNGRAVVNEAMLTGESVPQVKESIEVGQEDQGTSEQRLDLSDGSTHKRSVLFGGTVLMDHHSSSEDDEEATSTHDSTPNIPTPPNQGLVCFVLRTGFDTIQGSLLRTLAYHAESGNGGNGGGGEGVNAKETLIFLLILLLCALASAATVVHHAWGDVTRNHFKLILHIVIIITSVIPPELPMELSLAVTTSLSELVKQYQVFCTEPFRIPLAGLVDTCCFDKTGTLTSDELRLHGVRLPSITPDDSAVDSSSKKDDSDLILFDEIKSDDSNGDNAGIRSVLPSETLRVMVGCQSLAVTHVYVPGKNGRTTVQAELCGDPLEKAVMESCGYTIHPRTDMVMEKKNLLNSMNATAEAPSGSIKVLHRFAFSSKLRRMSVLAIDTDSDTLWALTKGAPEALQSMISTLPDDYQQSYLRHMTLGRRVLALAYRNLGKNTPATLAKWKASRDNVEQKLTFAGLLVMDSPLKADSARVIKELRGGNQNVVMVTGDAVLTAAEVARRVGIVDATQESTYELCAPTKDGKRFVFRPLGHSITGSTGKGVHNVVYFPTNPKLQAIVRQKTANFCITGDVLTKLAYHAVESASSSDQNSHTIDDRAVLNHPAARDALSALVPFISVFARHAPRHKEAVIAAFNASGCHTLMCGDGTNDVGALKKAHVGVSIISVPDLEAKQRSANDVISAAKAEEKRERKAAKKKKDGKSSSSTKSKPKKSRSERVNRSLQALAEAEDELNYVSLGNASVASPFTSRKTSVRCCKDILQQGRCTLVTMIQIYKILGVQCLVNALVLTTLHQKGVKQGDRQLTAVGVVVAILFLFVTRGKPLPKLSTQKPPSSVLCTETLISIAVQFGIHFFAIMSVTYISDAYVDPYDPSIVPDGPFHPNTLNTATFLVTVLSTINAFLVNYRGRPYMESLSENKLLFKSIQGCYFVLFVCAVEIFPPLNQLMQLSPLPTTGPPTFHKEGSSIGTEDHDESFVHDLLLGAVNSVGFQAMLCAIMIADTALVTLAEKSIRSVFGSK